MAITLRDNTSNNTGKGTELTYLEMDTNLESFYYSSSLSGTDLTFHTTGSTSHTVDLATAIGSGAQGIQGVQGVQGTAGTGIQGIQGIAGGAGAGTTPAGSDTQVQFNDGGSFGGDSGLLYDKTNNKLTVVSAGTGATTNPTIQLGTSDVSIAPGDTIGRISFANTDTSVGGGTSYAAIYAVAPTNWGGGNYPKDVRIAAVATAATVDVATFKGSGVVQLHDYGSGNNTGTAAKWLAVDSSGNVIEENTPSATGLTRPSSDTSVIYDTYLASSGYSVTAVGTNPAAPSSNGDVSIRYAVSNTASNVDRIDVYDSDGTNRSATLLNLAISGSITITQVGGGAHTEVYRILSVTDNTSYVSYAVDWASGDDAAMSTTTTDSFIFNADYEYELSTGYNRLLVTNNSHSSANQLRFAPPAGASAGDEVVVELKINSSSINVRPTYYVRNGTPTFMITNRVSQINGSTITAMELDTNDVAIMRFQVNDIGSIEGLMLLGAVQMVNG